MVARLKVTIPVGSDGTIQLGEDLIEEAGFKPGDVVRVQVEKAQPLEAVPERSHQEEGVDLDTMPRWTLEELFERFRIDEPVDEERDAEAWLENAWRDSQGEHGV